MERYDAIIIGAGPSGMTAALEAKRLAPHLSVLIIEKNEEVGRKLRATGNGRCNITNVEADGYMQCLEFFRRIGLALRQYENGLAYPYSESAADVAELLADKLKDFGIELMLGASVTGVEKNAEGFVVSGEGFVVSGDSLVLATGGKAGPNYGCTGDGYKFARNFGHTVVSPVPVLTSVECEEDCSRLGGNRARGKVTLLRDGEPVFMENGEIQFTKSGLSGICVFNMSRFMKSGSRDLSMFDIELDLYADGDIREFLRDRMKEESSED
ncbi:MAG: NAD(P)/FAD-dependent oxidoreductase, partial [Mogibacterium sp.]|nr:NAD(P)/FAD-dependent oxidoreductase [Mogibacterium sp.]